MGKLRTSAVPLWLDGRLALLILNTAPWWPFKLYKYMHRPILLRWSLQVSLAGHKGGEANPGTWVGLAVGEPSSSFLSGHWAGKSSKDDWQGYSLTSSWPPCCTKKAVVAARELTTLPNRSCCSSACETVWGRKNWAMRTQHHVGSSSGRGLASQRQGISCPWMAEELM